MFTAQIIIYILLGFAAEMIDGSLGMGYGVSSNTFLRTAGVPSAISSACVHVSEIFTTLVSALSHLKMKNVHKGLFFRLLFTGILGGIVGAYLLVNFESKELDIVIDIYLLIMGGFIFSKIFRKLGKPREYTAPHIRQEGQASSGCTQSYAGDCPTRRRNSS